jgi:hypothetical protein
MLLWPHMHAENYPNAWCMCMSLRKRLSNCCALTQVASHYITRYVFAVNISSECLRFSL